MQQKKAIASPSPVELTATNGNISAKLAASAASKALNIEVKSAPEPGSIEDLETYFETALTLPDIQGDLGHIRLKDIQGRHGFNASVANVRARIKDGSIDPETLQWVDKSWGQAGLICCCLRIGCAIGTFIPCRVK